MTTETLRCDGRIWIEGMDRQCRQSVGIETWDDYTGVPHHGCPNHVAGLRRRYPTELPERTAPAGTLGLGTPWTRGAFAPDDVIRVENAIPSGYRINVLAMNPRRFKVVGLRDSDGPCQCGEPKSAGIHDPIRTWVRNPNALHAYRAAEHPVELFRSEPTSDPLRVALAMCERLALHASDARGYVFAP